MLIEFSHAGLSLAVFALQGGAPAKEPDDPCSGDAELCPIADSIQSILPGPEAAPEVRLARHLSKHMQQGWLDCGLLDLQSTRSDQTNGPASVPGPNAGAIQFKPGAVDEKVALEKMGVRLRKWRCSIDLSAAECRVLAEALSHLPASALVTMPLTLWRLRRRLKRGARNGTLP